MMQSRLEFEDLVLIAAEVLDVPADQLEPGICEADAIEALGAPFAGSDEIDLYPHPVEKAAICCSAIIQSRPLPERNERVAYECMLEMLVRGDLPWPPPSADGEDIAGTLKRLAAGVIEEAEFVRWVRARVALGEWLRYQRRRGAKA
jgi:prophage maintenance system killer protein